MNQIKIADTTLCAEEGVFGFREKLEIARQLDKLQVDVIELPEIKNAKEDVLFIRTATSFLKNAVLSVAVGTDREGLARAVEALSGNDCGRIRIELPVSPVGMEYLGHKKPDAMLKWIEEAVSTACSSVSQVEFCAVDATRAEREFLYRALETSVSAGATCLSLCDSAAEILPDDFVALFKEVKERFDVSIGVRCNNKNGLAAASSVMSICAGADLVKTDVSGINAPLVVFASIVKDCGEKYGISSNIRQTELRRIAKQILWITNNAKDAKSAMTVSSADDESVRLDDNDDQSAVAVAVSKLGYDLSEDDQKKVFEEFKRVSAKKTVGSKELDAIVASVALQVPSTYKLVNYVVNTGNIISASAQITLTKEERSLQGICIGDGPIDAAFRAIDQIIGHHYELDDFQIQSVTEGKEAMGCAVVKLRAGGKVYSGNGISTDIIGASIRAYLNAVNKIVFEEA